MSLKGIRGAITVEKNGKEEIWEAAKILVKEILSSNKILPEDIGAIIFSSTEDLTAAFPTTGARKLPGMNFVPLFDTRLPDVETDLPMCMRVLILAETEKQQNEICHIYLRGAKNLRPDLKKRPD